MDHFFLASPPDLFTGSLSFLADFPASFFFLVSLGVIVSLEERPLPLLPEKMLDQKLESHCFILKKLLGSSCRSELARPCVES